MRLFSNRRRQSKGLENGSSGQEVSCCLATSGTRTWKTLTPNTNTKYCSNEIPRKISSNSVLVWVFWVKCCCNLNLKIYVTYNTKELPSIVHVALHLREALHCYAWKGLHHYKSREASSDFPYWPEKKLEDALKALSGSVKFHPAPRGWEQVPMWHIKKIINTKFNLKYLSAC